MKLLPAAGALLFAGLVATACAAGGGVATPPAATPSASASPDPVPTSTPATGQRPVVAAGVSSDGLTVRYQHRDGSTKTLRVEDFAR
jgi:hypothetical protein